MILTEIIVTYLTETSPFWIFDRYDQSCRQHWLRHIFYTQIFYTNTELCGNWTWSVACDIQFYAIFTAIFFIYAKYNFEFSFSESAVFYVILFN